MTFSVGEDMAGDISVGSRVIVGLGPKRYYSGIVLRLHGRKPQKGNARPVELVLDPGRAVLPEQLELWEWISAYYMCPLGIVMRAALPAKFKAGGYSAGEAADKSFRPKPEPYVRLSPAIGSEEKFNALLESMKRAKARVKVLLDYMALMPEPDYADPLAVPRGLAGGSPAVIKGLIDSGVFELLWKEPKESESRFKLRSPLPELTPEQKVALESVEGFFTQGKVTLLQGITGSGKTEIYIHLIFEALSQGGNVLFILPEISLTSQLIERMERYFPMTVYHSRVSDLRRAEIYRELQQSGGGRLIMGVRSSVFLPLPHLSLVIVDEEHDPSLKQSENAPRYHARDTAIMLASLYGTRTLLGSATPSLESYFNAVSGKYGHVVLDCRYGGVSLPRIVVADILRAARRGEKRSHFTKLLLDNMDKALEEKRQVLLFQNRRGYSPYVECGSCGWSAICPECNVTLTYHKSEGALRCHYCGRQQPMPAVCPSCGVPDLQPMGFGTEKVEQELAAIYPDAVIDRLDADTSRGAGSYGRIIRDFEQGRTDILVGTQMITKGFDFEGVSVVGILNADNLLNFPDFRASERAFSVMMQVGGRAGRRRERGTVVIQTSQPENPVIRQVVHGDYDAMARAALAERLSFLYPPYCRLISITLRSYDHQLLTRYASMLNDLLRPVFGRRALGPEPPPVDRIRGQHLLRFLLKIEKGKSAAEAKKILDRMLSTLWSHKEFRKVDIITDVDP